MRNICFVVTSMGGGGAERNVSILANYFVNHGDNVHIFMLFNSKVSYEIDSKVKFYFSFPKSKNLLSKITFWKKDLNKYCNENKIDDVVGIGIKYGIICSYALKNNKNINLIVRGTATYGLSFLEKIGICLFGKRINHFVCQTHAQKNTLPKELQKKCITICNPFEIYTVNRNNDGFHANRFVCVGRLKLETKKQDIIIKAFSSFINKTNKTNYVLDFYGSDNDNGKTLSNLEKLVKDLNVKNVYFHPFCSNIHEEIVHSTCFICCSTIEGMPNALIESLMLGIPAISSNWNGSDEIIAHSKNGYIFGKYNDVDSLEKYMEIVSNLSEKDYKLLSDNAYKMNIDKYNIESVLRKWNDILNK